MSEYGDGFGKTGMTVRRADGTFEVQVMSETFIFNRWLTFERHSKVCTCSWCNPWSLDFKKLPLPSGFGIEVPSRTNRWHWTHFHLRVGGWIYYLKLEMQIFPSVWPFFHAERWKKQTDETTVNA